MGKIGKIKELGKSGFWGRENLGNLGDGENWKIKVLRKSGCWGKLEWLLEHGYKSKHKLKKKHEFLVFAVFYFLVIGSQTKTIYCFFCYLFCRNNFFRRTVANLCVLFCSSNQVFGKGL